MDLRKKKAWIFHDAGLAANISCKTSLDAQQLVRGHIFFILQLSFEVFQSVLESATYDSVMPRILASTSEKRPQANLWNFGFTQLKGLREFKKHGVTTITANDVAFMEERIESLSVWTCSSEKETVPTVLLTGHLTENLYSIPSYYTA